MPKQIEDIAEKIGKVTEKEPIDVDTIVNEAVDCVRRTK